MAIRLSNAQVTRIREAVHRFEYIAWQGKVAREELVEDILKIVLPDETRYPMWLVNQRGRIKRI